MSLIIDGKSIAAQSTDCMKEQVALLKSRGIIPGLAVVLVGDDPASAIYVRNKSKACQKVGIVPMDYRLPATTSISELLGLLDKLNHDPRVHGILVQLPLPKHLDATAVISAILPQKDVDGLHPLNMGRLMQGLPSIIPCTPRGVMTLIKTQIQNLRGKRALVVGRSVLVGKPMGHLLLNEHCTVTFAHSHTRHLDKEVGEAEILVVAAGQPNLVKGEWIRPEAIVIDVGMNRLEDCLVGDVEFSSAVRYAAAITPVPGGVGPMTIAMLLQNTIDAALQC